MSAAMPEHAPTTWELSVEIPAVYKYVHNFRPTIHPRLQKDILELLFRQKYLESDTLSWDHSYLEKPKPMHDPKEVFVFQKGDIIDVAYSRSELPDDIFIENEQPRVPGKRLAVTFDRLGVSADMMNTFLCIIENTNELMANKDLLFASLEADDDPVDERIYRWHKNPNFYLDKFERDLLRLEVDLVELGMHLQKMVQLVDKLNRLHG